MNRILPERVLNMIEQVKKHRAYFGFSIRDLAKRTNISVATLSRFERGMYIPSLINWWKLEKELSPVRSERGAYTDTQVSDGGLE